MIYAAFYFLLFFGICRHTIGAPSIIAHFSTRLQYADHTEFMQYGMKKVRLRNLNELAHDAMQIDFNAKTIGRIFKCGIGLYHKCTY